MAAPTVGSFLLVANYDTLQNQITALENTGIGAVTSASSTLGTFTITSYGTTFASGGASVALSVVLAAGQNCLITHTSELKGSVGAVAARQSFAVSGAATEAATDARSVVNDTTTGTTCSRSLIYTAGSAGTYTFTLQHKVASGTGTRTNYSITAVPLPYNS